MSPAEALLAQAVEFHKVGDLGQAVPIYNQLLNMEPFNPGVLFLMGDAMCRAGSNGLAINILSNAISIQPSAEAYTALGCAYKFEGHTEMALEAWSKALELDETPEILSNLACIYADSGRPEQAFKYVNRSLELKPGDPHAVWNRALANLTSQQWAQGWADHESRFNPNIIGGSKKRNFGCPEWDGTPGKRIAVHGEQGIGDEVMFLSMLPDLLAVCPDVVIEVEPRLIPVVEETFGITAYGREDAMKAHEAPFDYQIALGSLGQFFRKETADFPGTAYMKANPERVAFWRHQYAMQGDGPYIGVAWQGGAKATRILERTIDAKTLEFAKKGTAICLQYGQGPKEISRVCGYNYWPESDGSNMHEFFAMVAACDMVVTTPQTLVHVAGSLGVPCHVLTPFYPSWRYGIATTMPWYKSVCLHRQKSALAWGHPLAEAKKAVDKVCRKYSRELEKEYAELKKYVSDQQ